MSSKKFPLFTATVEIDDGGMPHVFFHWHEGFRSLNIHQQGLAYLAALDAFGDKGIDLITDVQAAKRKLLNEMKGEKNA